MIEKVDSHRKFYNSLTSQLKCPESPVRRFFLKFEDKKGLRQCFAKLQSSKPLQKPTYQVREIPFHAVIHTVEIVDRESKLKNGVISQNERLAQALLGISIGENTNIEIKGVGIRTIKVLKIKPGNPPLKKTKTYFLLDREKSDNTKISNEKQENPEFEFIDQFISLIKVMPRTKNKRS